MRTPASDVRAVSSDLVDQARLTRAFDEGEFVAHYQPLVRLADGAVWGVEALVRWNVESVGTVMPSVFMPHIERSAQLTRSLTSLMMGSTCAQVAEWRRDGIVGLRASVNVSGRDLTDGLVECVLDALSDTGLDPDALSIEITESTAMGPDGSGIPAYAVVSALRDLTGLGVHLMLDDFGVGYSGLQQLGLLPIDGIKLDRGIVALLGRSVRVTSMLQGIVSLAEGLKLSVVAEGVEHEDQVDHLLGLGITQGQGFLYGAPMAAPAMTDMLRRPVPTAPRCLRPYRRSIEVSGSTVPVDPRKLAADLDHRLAIVLGEFASTLLPAPGDPIQSILDHLVEWSVDVLPITAAGATLGASGRIAAHLAASDDVTMGIEVLQSELREGPSLMAVDSGEAVIIPFLESDARFPRFASRALVDGLVAVFSVPIHHGDEALGALDLYCDTPGPLDDVSMAAAKTLAEVAASYLLNAQHRAELTEESERFRRTALHDSLTGLPNRALLRDRLDHAMQRSRRSRKITAVIFADLDDFKAVNDTHGHLVGDELLQAVARRLDSVIRPGDTLGRLGGDEFVILCEDLENASHAETVASRISAAAAQPFALSVGLVRISASLGVAFADGTDESPEKLLQRADAHMYLAKRRGGDRFEMPLVVDPVRSDRAPA